MKGYLGAFDLFELYNLIAGSILGGIIGLLLVVIYDKYRERRKKIRLNDFFTPLESQDLETFDWVCFDIIGRKKSEPNGSMAYIKYLGDYNLEIRVKEKDADEISGPVWIGYITMTDLARGSLTFKYQENYEYGVKRCYLGQEREDGKIFDYLILVGDGNAYGSELVRRERKWMGRK